jgi:PKD repeat protein
VKGPLALSAKTFSLSHRYLTPGKHTVTVTVSDDDGGVGSRSATVNVMTPQDGIQTTLIDEIGKGSTSGLAAGNVTALRAPLAAAQDALNRGNLTAANEQLKAFLNQVDGLVRGRQITATASTELTAKVNRILASINR